jgi:hypothetical protein
MIKQKTINLDLLYEMLLTIFRGEIGLVAAGVEQSVGAVNTSHRGCTETKGLKAQMDTMPEQIDKLRGEPDTPGANVCARYTAVAASAIDATSAAETETDRVASPPHWPAQQRRDTSPTPTLVHSLHAGRETDPAQPPPSTSAVAIEPAPHHGETDEGWKKVERKRKRKGKGRKERSTPPWADKAQGRGVDVTVSIGESRDTRPQKATQTQKCTASRGSVGTPGARRGRGSGGEAGGRGAGG